ncbi:TPA: hypothetical protein QHR59_002112 [Klebsiella aerogenes]|uniref:hypothetical protein n=1 Tax=Klebsiella aerogenes TaxID=548 RepID=UPI0010FEBC29|nr:hypothetical protein [Klebsiella aerogenes]EIV5432949.1 hypothetical protein [Klebsiella aerogenes]ELA2557947.1 hypothetical protein [Klebsiella aerogenes]HDS5832093.1 hypothetical protein [Klebsiella aerogenes]HDS6478854.1 hypothetical protein [Klebsiella aerogenes]HDT4996312.1 hypothetical protein [Klebsiella aerogenes]
MEAMKGAFLGWVSQGLQHEVIVMASCCKKGGGQKGNNCHRQVYTQQCLWYCITVLMRDWVVVLCVSISVVALVSAATEPTSIWKTTTKRALITTVDHPAREALLPPMLSSLHPRLFRGVTPDRHNGELQLRA